MNCGDLNLNNWVGANLKMAAIIGKIDLSHLIAGIKSGSKDSAEFWIDKNLSITQIGELFSMFNETDEQIGYSPTKYEAFVKKLDDKFKSKEV